MTFFSRWDYGYETGLIMTLAVSTLSYYAYERPMRRLIRG